MMRRALPAARHPMEGLSAAIDRLPPALQETYDCLRHLNGTTTGFWCMDLIPALVSLYDWLYDCQGHILSLDDSYVKTMGALFQELA